MAELKIAMVTPWHVRCGIATYSEHLAYALAEEGVEVDIVRLPRFGQKSPEILQDVAERVPNDVDLIHVEHEYGLFQNLDIAFYKALKQLQKLIVTTMHAMGNLGVDDFIAATSSRVIVHNEYCLKRFPYPNALIIPHGATPTEASPSEESKKIWGIDPKFPVVGYLGFISPYKGLENLIQAMVDVKAGLLMGGGWHVETETQYMEALKAFGNKLLPRRVQWLGFVSDEMLKYAYGAMDVFVYPSRFATESGALITALSYGRAVVASDLPPFKEKQEALMTFSDVKDLTEKINQLLENKELREQQQEKAKEYAKKTSWSEVAKQHVELYRQVLKA